MFNFDFNRFLQLMALIAIVVIAALTDYRFEIGTAGFKFESNKDRISDLRLAP
jgi:hypothetical protein